MKPRSPRSEKARNERGSAEDRRRRRVWLVEMYRANKDVPDFHHFQLPIDGCPLGMGEPACRCFRCGALLTVDTVTVDRIIPGCKGGTYRRNNIRPACLGCNSSLGSSLHHQKRC